jgi:hypothetical protein
MSENYRALCETAVAALDEVLAEHPDKINDELNEAARCLVRTRDGLIDQRRQGENVQSHLDQVNAILSVVVGSEYPLVGVRWDRVQEARNGLAALLADNI